MPTYQYECSACKHHFEVWQSMTEERLRCCPKCGKNNLARLIGSGSGIIFKGSGFYETDYKRKEPAKSESKTGESANSTAVKTAAGSTSAKTTPPKS